MESQPGNPEFRINPEKLSPMLIFGRYFCAIGGKNKNQQNMSLQFSFTIIIMNMHP